MTLDIARRRTMGRHPGVAYSVAVLADSPVSYWRLNEPSGTNAADQQGANAGTYTGSFVLGVAGATSDLDLAVQLGGGGYVNTSFNPFVHGASQTFECFAKSLSTPANKALLGGSTLGSTPPSLWFDAATTLAWYPANVSEGVWASAWPGNGVWVHVALTWNDSTKIAELFIDGVSEGTKNVGQAYSTSGNFQIGAASGTSPFPGVVDEVAVYNTALSSVQIAAHHAAA